MTKELFLDATDMEPPEPLIKTLELAENLQPGAYIRFRHWREPFMLYDNLEQQNFSFIACISSDAKYEVFIWNKDDAAAESAAQSQIQLSQLAIHASNINNTV